MDTFSLIRNSVAATENDPDKAGLDYETRQIGRVVTAVQVVVDALTPPDGGRYIVAFADINTAATSLGTRRIVVSSKPLHDPTLSLVEKAVVIATFAAHEIGHTLVTRPRKGLVFEHNSKSGYHAVANLADDIILEPYMVERFPILADAFEFTGLWVLRTTAESLPITVTMKRKMSTPDRFNVLLDATRYSDDAPIIWSQSACDEQVWGKDWAARLIALRLTDHRGFIALCDEAWERIRTEPDVEPEPEPPVIIDEDEVDDDESDDDDEDGTEPGDEPGEDADDDESDDEDGEPEPGEDGEPDEDADDDEQDPDEGKGDDEGGDDGIDEGGLKVERPGKGGDDLGKQDDDVDWDDDETEPGENPDGKHGGDPDDGHIQSDQDTPPDADGGGGNAEATVRDEDDFDKDEVDQSTHDQSERDPRDWQAAQDEKKVRTYTSTSVTAFGKHGSLSTDWQ